MKSVFLDYANMLAPNLGRSGFGPSRTGRGPGRGLSRGPTRMWRPARLSGEMGFFSLPEAREAARAVQELADGFGQWFENLVVLGIGGSALGTTTLRDSLLGPHWNELDEEARDHYPRLYVLDNVDPRTVSLSSGPAGPEEDSLQRGQQVGIHCRNHVPVHGGGGPPPRAPG